MDTWRGEERSALGSVEGVAVWANIEVDDTVDGGKLGG
jgi:hypothetical protein